MSTITREFTKERLTELSRRENVGAILGEEIAELARIALASLEAEAVAWLLSGGGAKNHVSFDSGNAYADPLREVTPLYTATPAPVALTSGYSDFEEIWSSSTHPLTQDDEMKDFAWDIWNACRAAMLQGAEPVTTDYKLPEETGSSLQLRNLIRQRHAEWSQATFGDVGPVGPLKHLSKEALEAAEEPEDLSEWADMQFLLWDAQRRAGISDGEITAAMEEKLKVNMARQWPEPKDGEPRLHIKENGNSPVILDGWIACSERMPEEDTYNVVADIGSEGNIYCAAAAWFIHGNFSPMDGVSASNYDGGASIEIDMHISHWMPLPAAPQQEVK